jgi:hypothetical protein
MIARGGFGTLPSAGGDNAAPTKRQAGKIARINRASGDALEVKNDLPDSPPGSDDDLEDIVNTIVGHFRGDNEVRLAIRELAAGLLAAWRDQTQSPTATSAEKSLEAVRHAAIGLAEALSALPEFLRVLMETWYTAASRWDPEKRAIVRLDLGALPREAALYGLAQAVQHQLESWRHPRVLNRVRPSASGKKLAYERLLGDVRTFYASRVAELIAKMQSIKAVTTKEGGSLDHAFSGLWTYATGLPSEGHNLQDHVRHAAQVQKQRHRAKLLEQKPLNIRKIDK